MASHRLIQCIGKRYGLKMSEMLYDKLNVYYFVEGHSLNDKMRLAAVAHEVIVQNSSTILQKDEQDNNDNVTIMSEQEILDFLNGDEGRREIENAIDALYNMGIHGIPKFIIEGRRVVDGAAHSNVFIDIFRDIERKGIVYDSSPIFGDILGVNEEIVRRSAQA